jgi:hypothetical protein
VSSQFWTDAKCSGQNNFVRLGRSGVGLGSVNSPVRRFDRLKRFVSRDCRYSEKIEYLKHCETLYCIAGGSPGTDTSFRKWLPGI